MNWTQNYYDNKLFNQFANEKKGYRKTHRLVKRKKQGVIAYTIIKIKTEDAKK